MESHFHSGLYNFSLQLQLSPSSTCIDVDVSLLVNLTCWSLLENKICHPVVKCSDLAWAYSTLIWIVWI